MIPRATYRLQFHRDFPFHRAEALVPYFADLGISHIYASPVTVARSGSMHGYDVVDPTSINPELGGEDALRSLVAALRARGMGLIIDIVPNHMGVAGGENPWWTDVLANGPGSDFAHFFDIDWSRKLLLPILGAPLPEVLEAGQITIARDGDTPELLVHGEHRLPLRSDALADWPPEPDADTLLELIEQQHYRPVWWRKANDEINWRRFFTINDLAGLRVEDPRVFDATHALYFRLWREGLIDGVRIDHIDGLSDPEAYLHTLRERFQSIPRPAELPQAPAYIVVEKILGPGEQLPASWPIEGTSGYDFMNQASAALHDASGEAPLTELWQAFSDRSGEFHEEERTARKDILDWAFTSQLEDCVDAFVRLAASAPASAGLTRAMLKRGLERLLWVFPVYRTYGSANGAPPEDERVREQVRAAATELAAPGESAIVDMLLDWLAGSGPGDADLVTEAVRRFQQLSAPIAAKAVEDTAFYRHATLLSRLDVGFEAGRFALSTDEFLAISSERARKFPHAMLATATHDHKRGEDVRCRLAVLSQVPDKWASAVREWDASIASRYGEVDSADRYIAYQTLFGAWPEALDAEDEGGLAAYAQRLKQWQAKALREAKLRSSWSEQDDDYERLCASFIDSLCAPASGIPAAVSALVEATQSATNAAMLAQVAMRNMLPGVPDCYQGCELPDWSLVDPDNRRPVDYDQRAAMLAGTTPEHPKFALSRETWALRAAHPEVFAEGALVPAKVTGQRSAYVLAFSRSCDGKAVDCAMVIKAGAALFERVDPAPSSEWWGDTAIAFENAGSALRPSDLFTTSPVYIRTRGE